MLVAQARRREGAGERRVRCRSRCGTPNASVTSGTWVGPQTGTVTARILAPSVAHNAAHAVSGVLCQGQGLYLQVLEGERAEVNRLYARILQDRRH
jgi:hypothetical protein